MSGPRPSSGPECWGQEGVLLKLVCKKGQKVDQVRNRISQRGSVGSWKRLNTPLSAAAKSTLMFKTEHGGGKSEDAFLLFKLTRAEQRANSFKICSIPSQWVPAGSQIHRRQIWKQSFFALGQICPLCIWLPSGTCWGGTGQILKRLPFALHVRQAKSESTVAEWIGRALNFEIWAYQDWVT